MAFGILPKSTDTTPIPISSVYVPGVGFIALAGSTLTSTDGSSNISTSAVMSLGPANTTSITLQSAQAGNANGTLLPVLGYGSIVFTVTMAGYTGTVTFEGTEDNASYDPILAAQMGTNTIASTVVGAVTTSIHLWEASVLNFQNVRARTSGAAAGTVTVTAHAFPLALGPRVINANIVSAGTLALETGGNLATVATRTPALGSAVGASSSPVVIASDQAPLVTGTATRSNVTASITDVSLLASNAGRKGATIFNDSTSVLFLGFGSGTTSATSFTVQVAAGGFFELPPAPVFTAALRGIWTTANGAARITELT